MTKSEIWKSLKDIVECGDYYEVSNIGNVRSIDRYVKSKGNGMKFKIGEDMSKTPDKDGYLRVTLSKDSIQKTYKIHRLVAMAFISNLENKDMVNHINGIKYDNRFDNLEWCTNSENQIHAIEIGLVKIKKGKEHHSYGKEGNKGETNGMSKLNLEKAKEILKLCDEGDLTLKQIGELFGVSAKPPFNIKKNRTWGGQKLD